MNSRYIPPRVGPQTASLLSAAVATPPQRRAPFQKVATFSGSRQSTVTHVISTLSIVAPAPGRRGRGSVPAVLPSTTAGTARSSLWPDRLGHIWGGDHVILPPR